MSLSYFLIFSLLGKEPKKEHLNTVLHDIRAMWDIIGEQLAVSNNDIMCAEHYAPNNCTRKLSKILQVWIDQRTSEVSWKKIITVVEDPPVECKQVAEKIFHFLKRPDIKNEYISSDQPGKVKKIHLAIVPVSLYRSSNYYF